ncbi:MAG: glycosyltransferase [Patescibacteria group bacterium]
MKLLIVTQALDLDDPILSAYHGWVEALAKECESVEAVCLSEGRHSLPANVIVHSLGKENGRKSRLAYALAFLMLAWRLRGRYDAAFVHMNQEYLLIAGPLWKILGKRAYLWRNHYAGSFLTDLAALFSTNVFCTSRHSYTAKYGKTVFMPVGVNTDRFSRTQESWPPRSILFFSRIAPSKHADLFIEALGMLKEKGVPFTASIVGSAPKEFEGYAMQLRERASQLGLDGIVTFSEGVVNEEAPRVYGAHALFVNCSPSGMLDKMIFEAAASGCLILTENDDLKQAGFADVTYEPGSAASLAEGIERLLDLDEGARAGLEDRLLDLVEKNSLTGLARSLVSFMRQKRQAPR